MHPFGSHFGEYSCFAELAAAEAEGVDYLVHGVEAGSHILIMAPHGGGIEPGTSEIARALSSPDWSYYGFEGIKQSGNRVLHITSTRFDEPRAWGMLSTHSVVITLHGCTGPAPAVFLGGLHCGLLRGMTGALRGSGFETGVREEFSGRDPRNLCNRGAGGMGVQLELTWGLRLLMFRDLTRAGRTEPSPLLRTFVAALTSAIGQ